MAAASFDSPIGRLTVVEREGCIAALSWRSADDGEPTALLQDAIAQLRRYFARELRSFDLPLRGAPSPEAQADCWAGFDTLYTVLETFSRAVAPLLPFTAEVVWRGLTGVEPLPNGLHQDQAVEGGDA